MKCKFSWQELLLKETMIERGIDLLSALQISVSCSGKPFYCVPTCLCSRAQFYLMNSRYGIFKNSLLQLLRMAASVAKKLLRLLSWISEAAALKCSKIFGKIAKKTSLVECFW